MRMETLIIMESLGVQARRAPKPLLAFMVAVDGSPRAMEAFMFAVRLACAHGGAIHVVHLLDASSADAVGEHSPAGIAERYTALVAAVNAGPAPHPECDFRALDKARDRFLGDCLCSLVSAGRAAAPPRARSRAPRPRKWTLTLW